VQERLLQTRANTANAARRAKVKTNGGCRPLELERESLVRRLPQNCAPGGHELVRGRRRQPELLRNPPPRPSELSEVFRRLVSRDEHALRLGLGPEKPLRAIAHPARAALVVVARLEEHAEARSGMRLRAEGWIPVNLASFLSFTHESAVRVRHRE
jgi:hypothetical protein